MLTPDQEKYLADLADKGIADQKVAEAQQAELDKIYVPIEDAKQAKLVELTKQAQPLVAEGREVDAQQLIEVGMKDFVNDTVPQMLADAGVQSGS